MKEVNKIASTLKFVAIILIIVGLLLACIGFYKVFVYENSEYPLSSSKNAYVGGDAYNYIINGTYFAGYMAIAGALIVSGAVCSCTAKYIIVKMLMSKSSFSHSVQQKLALDLSNELPPI